MRGSTTSARVVPRGEYMLTLKARGELVGGETSDRKRSTDLQSFYLNQVAGLPVPKIFHPPIDARTQSIYVF